MAWLCVNVGCSVTLVSKAAHANATKRPSTVREYASILIILALALFSLSPGAARPANVTVTDGDSLKIDGERIRLWGVDAPELGQKCEWRRQPFDCGRAAKETLIRLTQGRLVECHKVATDRHGRTVARCQAGGEDLATAMVRAG